MNDPSKLQPLQGEIALVTGATRGIGAGIAEALASAGAQVIGTATTEAGAAAISARFGAAGHSGRGAVVDVSDPASIAALEKDVSANEGAVTVLVNNAGITRDGLLVRMKKEDWDAVIQTNLSSAFHVCKTFLRGMIKARHGRIVSIASVVGSMGNPGQANYAAAKAGLVGFSKSLAREVGARGVTVNVVAPGFIETEMTAALDDSQVTALIDQIPVNRLGHVEDVAGVVAFLCSPAGAYITGETIHVNGGMLMI